MNAHPTTTTCYGLLNFRKNTRNSCAWTCCKKLTIVNLVSIGKVVTFRNNAKNCKYVVNDDKKCAVFFVVAYCKSIKELIFKSLFALLQPIPSMKTLFDKCNKLRINIKRIRKPPY